MYNHYIRIDENNNIIKSFSTAFELPTDGDILIAEDTEERHYNLNLLSPDGFYLLKYENDEIIEKTEAEIYDLSYYKSKKIIAIDLKTRQLIAQGFEYNNTKFSLSIEAQSNWSSLFIKANAGRYLAGDWPISVTTIDDNLYQIPDEDTLIAIYETGMTKKQSYINSGRDLKLQVKAAGTIEDLNNVNDNRI